MKPAPTLTEQHEVKAPSERAGSHALIWIILAAAALLRVIYLMDYRAHSVFWNAMLLDAEIYDKWAQRIAAGDWLSGQEVYTLPPLYPYFLAAIYRLFGHGYAAVYAIQSLMGLADIYLIYSIGKKVFGRRTATISAALTTLYGSLMFTESKLMSTTLALTLGLCLMRLLILAGERQTLTLWAACGALLGFTALARPETLLFAPFAGWWIYDVTRGKDVKKPPVMIDQYALAGRQRWFALSVFTTYVVIAIAPVTLRNCMVTEDWNLSNLISSQAGITFFQSNNERARGLYVFLSHEGFSGNPETQAQEEKTLAEKATGRAMKRSEVTRYWFNRGLDWILGNPGKFIVLECRKLRRFLGSYEYSTEYIIRVERETVKSLWIAFLAFSAISGLAVAGILTQRKEGFRAPARLLVLFVASNLLVVMTFYVSSRYRMPSAPYLLLFAGVAVERIWSGLRSPVSSRRNAAWSQAAIAGGLFLIFHPQIDQSHKIQEANLHYNAGNKYVTKKQYDDAVAEYNRALAGDHGNWRAWYNLGNTLSAMGRRDDAMQAYREALKYNSGFTAARKKLESLGATP